MSSDSMGNLEKLGILVIVILVVVVGVVAITPSDTLFPNEDGVAAALGEEEGEILDDADRGGTPGDVSLDQRPPWPGLDARKDGDSVGGDREDADRARDDWRETPKDREVIPVRPAPTRILPPESQPATVDAGDGTRPGGARREIAPRIAPLRPSATRTYLVKKGETLSEIAERELGATRLWRRIAELNPTLDPDRIKPGMRLTLPSVARATKPSAPVRPGSAPALAPAPGTYVVKSGDTLSGIAARFLGRESRWRRIVAANPAVLDDPDDLKVGMRLRIPEGDTSAASSPRTASRARQPVPRTTTAGRTYRVEKGDSFYRIAESLLGSGEKWQSLFDANRSVCPRPNDLRPGMLLRVPAR